MNRRAIPGVLTGVDMWLMFWPSTRLCDVKIGGEVDHACFLNPGKSHPIRVHIEESYQEGKRYERALAAIQGDDLAATTLARELTDEALHRTEDPCLSIEAPRQERDAT